jgi:hypothetical protein
MRKKMFAACTLSGILIVCMTAAVLAAGCSSPTAKSFPPLTTLTALTTPATSVSATVPPPTPGGTCRQGLTWCHGHCSDLSADIADCGACGNPCFSGQSCVNGQCCQRGQALCNGLCSDVTADVNNCGRCGTVCPAGSLCYQAKCLNMSIVCPLGQTECYDGRCHDLTSDNMNCGRCGTLCPAYSGCTHSVCVAMEG